MRYDLIFSIILENFNSKFMNLHEKFHLWLSRGFTSFELAIELDFTIIYT